MIPKVKFDFETRSGYDITDVGRHKYVLHKDADIICLSWKVDGLPTKLWLPGAPVPPPFLQLEKYQYAAFNIQFDAYIIETLGKRYGFLPIPLEKQIDVMAVAARFSLPQKLDHLGKALKVKMQKMSIGTKLKNIFCSPPYGEDLPKDKYNEQLKLFYAYCIMDTDSMDECMRKMPLDHLPPSEQHIWQVNCEMNRTGVPVDHAAVVRIDEVCDYYRTQKAKLVPKITNDVIDTIGQRDRILEWCEDQGVVLENFQAQTVSDAIEDLEGVTHVTPEQEKVLKLLKLRQLIGGAAVKKYKKLNLMCVNGRIYDNSRYHGAGTGRTTGGGFQMLNLPRATVQFNPDVESYDEAAEKAIQSFYDTTVLKTAAPLEVAKGLVRPMLYTKDGWLIVADYSSIEYILLMWYAGEWRKVKAFALGEDPYRRFASKLFGVPYEEVTKAQRNQGKAPILGSGYMLSWGAPDPKTGKYTGLIAYADGMGITMIEEEAQFATNLYRTDHPLVKQTWYDLKGCAHNAIKHKGQTFASNNTRFCVKRKKGLDWLIITLPSGRSLFYCSPYLVDGKYGSVIKHWGINPDTKQWGWKFLKPQRIIENIIQGLGRDVLTHGMDRVLEKAFTPIGTIYDEIICEERTSEPEKRLEEMCKLMCVLPPWANGLPLKAEGYYAKRYRKE